MSYLVLDLETSAENSQKRFQNPFDPNSSLTVVALRKSKGPIELRHNTETWADGLTRESALTDADFEGVQCIVGQNLKFDLVWLWENPALQRFLARGGEVWDLMTVEYLLQGQQTDLLGGGFKGLSLDKLSEKYGGELKDDRVSTLYKAGYQTKDIDPDLILPYAEGDIKNTEIVFQNQLKQVIANKQWPLVKAYMKHYVALCEMEFNGLYVDRSTAERNMGLIEAELQELTTHLQDCAKRAKFPDDIDFNPSSTEHISIMLFGGHLDRQVQVPCLDDDGQQIYYKTGQRAGEPKTKKGVEKIAIAGYRLPKKHTTKARKDGFYSTSDKVLQEVATHCPEAQGFLDSLQKYRKNIKLMSTYYYMANYNAKGELKSETGLLAHVQPTTSCIHSEFKTTITETGRLSSRSPNMQNLDPSVLDMFCSRFGEQGVICELDFSQLEVVIQAFITQCPNMIKDITNKVDFHCLRLSYAEDMPYEVVVKNCEESDEWKQKRKKAKIVSFQKAYGAAPAKIANETGLSEDIVNKIFLEEDLNYPEIGRFYEMMVEQINASTKPTKQQAQAFNKSLGVYEEIPNEYQKYGTYRSLTGKLYTFKQRISKTNRGLFRYYLMPQVQNYPIQGTAADLMAMQVGELMNYFLNNRDKCLLINEVHDSIILDVKKEYLDEVLTNVKKRLEDVDINFKRYFKREFNVPIGVDYTFGKTWKDCK